MDLIIPVKLSDEQISAIAEKIAEDRAENLLEKLLERVQKLHPDFGKRTKPYSVKEFCRETGIKQSTLSNKIRAGRVEVVPGVKPYRIPAREVERMKGLRK